MGYGSYTLSDGREAGYLVDAECDFPGCKREVSRGMDQLCGQNPIGHKQDGEPGCGNYYCGEHEDKHDCTNPACGKYAAEGRGWCGGLLAGHELPHRDAYTDEEFTQTEDDLANEDGMIVTDAPTPDRAAPTRYRSIQVEMDAMQLIRENVAAIEAWLHAKITEAKSPGPGRGMHDVVVIRSVDRKVQGQWGDWVLCDGGGNFCVTRDDHFRACYELTES